MKWLQIRNSKIIMTHRWDKVTQQVASQNKLSSKMFQHAVFNTVWAVEMTVRERIKEFVYLRSAPFCAVHSWPGIRCDVTRFRKWHTIIPAMRQQQHCTICHYARTVCRIHRMCANRLKLNADKTEFLWTGSLHSVRELFGNGPSRVLGADDIDEASVAHLLGV